MAEIVLQNPQALLVLPMLWLLLVIISWGRRFRPYGPFFLRLLIVVLICFALARPALPATEAVQANHQTRIITLIDQSVSLPDTMRAAFRAEAARLAQQFPHMTILYFAGQPIFIPPVAPSPNGESMPLPLNPALSNLDKALTTGANLLNNQPGRLVLLSDGLSTDRDRVEAALDALARQNVPVDVLISSDQNAPSNDVRVVSLNVPPLLREGETFDVEVILHSQVAGQADLRLVQDLQILAESTIDLETGLNRFSFAVEAGEIGPHTFEATITAPDEIDSQPANNSFSAFTEIYPPPQILVVGNGVLSGNELLPVSRFMRQVEQAGFVIEQIGSQVLPSRLSELEPYAGMILVDVSARSLKLEQMIAIQEFVRSLGRGLLVTGGRNSFSLGEYEDTPLAELLPLSLEPPPREERPPVALLLVIDHSGSMMERSFPATKLAMAKEAAIRATDILGPDDLIGVLVFDNLFEWVIPFQAANDGAALLDIQTRIATIDGGGGTRVLQALEVALPELAAQNTFNGPRHAVLFTDGKSFDGLRGPEDYDEIVDAAVAANITLSTIAIGQDADQELLERIAERGLGRYHYAAEPEQLPALTIAESDILRSNSVQEGEYRPAPFAPHSMLRGLTSNAASLQGGATPIELPNLSGYIGLSPKPEAEIVLQVGPGDPLLGVWGYGLGRVAAWGSDVGHEWAGEWATWPEASRFWGQVIGYTLPAPNLGLLQLSVEVEPGGVVILQADGVTATGQTVDLARTVATLITPTGREIPINLRQISPGRYQQRLRLPDSGAYQLTVTQNRTEGPDETATMGFVVPYSAEYSLPDSALGENLLREIAAATGGQTFSFGETLRLPVCDPATEDCRPAADQRAEASSNQLEGATALWPWLLQAALVLWPLEIAWRRWRRLRIQ